MAVSVLVVDDSSFIRKRICEILEADGHIEVIGAASNGREAVAMAQDLRPDVITMDVEMPVMDGITAVRHIMSQRPCPILMFSSLTTKGAQATLDALEAGAVDFLPKNMDDISTDREFAKRQLRARVRLIGARGLDEKRPLAAEPVSRPERSPGASHAGEALRAGVDLNRYELLLIGTSTGGPAALPRVLSQLPSDFPLPIVLLQHMPGSFTPPFAQRLDNLCQIAVKHAADRDRLTSGVAVLAPGGAQLEIERKAGAYIVRVREATKEQTYKPCVDMTFASAARAVNGKVLAIVLTGMGADGREGAKELKEKGATIWAQDEATCVVAGMPVAVAEAGLADRVLPLDEIGALLREGARNWIS